MSNSLRDKEMIWHPYTHLGMDELAINIIKAKGTTLYDDQGKEYIDAIASWWTNIHGHAHPYIAKKIYEQSLILEHVIFSGFTHPKAIELAEKLLQVLPEKHEKIFFSDNGSTSVEIALKMAIQYWYNKGTPKTKIIAFRNSFHGETFGSMSVSERNAFTKPFSNFLFDMEFLDVPNIENIKEVSATLDKLTANGEVAAFLFEPLVLGTAGMVMYEPEWLEQLLNICQKSKVLTIADEVMTGFYRTGKMFATDYLSTKPDIICMSKGITGGFLPLGVTSCTNDIYNAFYSKEDKFKTFFHGHSYTANPLACTAALASLELLQAKECKDKIQWIAAQHLDFKKKISKLKQIKDCRCRGTIIAIEFHTNEQSGYFNPLRDKLYQYYISKGVLLRPLGNVVYIMPPYCISEEELNKVYEVILSSIDELAV